MNPKNGWCLVLAVAILMLLILACGSGTSSGIGLSTFAKVCSSGEGAEHDAYYGSAADGAGPFPVLVYRLTYDGKSWLRLTKNDLGREFPSDWYPPEAELTELVVCLTIIEREVALECNYTATTSEDQEFEFVVQHTNTTYEAKLYSAETAEEYATTTLQAMAEDKCPETAIGRVDDEVKVKIQDANPAVGLIPFLEPWVEK